MTTRVDPDAIHEFPADRAEEAHVLAKRMAKYGRRDWIVWWLADGTRKAAKLTLESLRTAMSEAVGNESRPGYFHCIQKNDGCGLNVSPALARV